MKASEIQPKKLVIFDIDDTLVYTQTKVHVIKDNKIVASLNSHDFTHYKLKPGEKFDFGDFSNAKEFFDNSKPNIPMMNQLRRDINTGNKVVMVTARSDFDDKELFLNTFRKFGVDIDKVHVYRAGNSKQGTTEERKKSIIKTLLDKDDYSKAIMYDDAKPNLNTFIELKKDHPRTRFYAWHVNPKGEAAEYMREEMVSEKKRKRRPRWAAYGPGPYGGYGYYAGYSGDAGSAGGGDGGGGESIEPDEPGYQHDLLTMPANTLVVDTPGELDWYKIGQHFPTIGQSDPHEYGQSESDMIITFADKEEMLKFIKLSKKLGLKVKGISGSPEHPEIHSENFADGKKPGRKGLAKRSGVNCKASVTSLRKTAKNSSGEKRRMAHWCANMKSGKAKKK